MRANEGTLVALDTFIHLPFRYIDRDTAFFVSGSAAGESTVDIFIKGADRQVIAFQTIDWGQDIIDKFVAGNCDIGVTSSISPGCRYIDLHNSIDTAVDSRIVHVKNSLAFQSVGMIDSFFQILDGISQRNNIRQFEKG